MDRLPLSLDPASRQPPASKPVIGWLAVGCAVLGILTHGYVFVPIAIVLSVVSLVVGQAGWAFAGLFLSVIGFLTSPVLLTLVGLGALAAYLGMI
jgi:hypothetical protein